ncbi:MAG: DUF1579 family protein [Roseivirga sp.]|nr:DUF1579 family protein [Roseivirga sp.]
MKASLFVLIPLLFLPSLILAQNNDPAPEVAHLAPLIGVWEIYQERLSPQGIWTKEPQTPTWSFEWAMDGHAVLDRWESKVLNPATQDSIPFHGINLRTYDAKAEKWQIEWVDNITHRFTNFEGTSEPGEFRMEGINSVGRPAKIRFFDFKPDSFKWEQSWTFDNGKTWVVVSKMNATRKP